MRLQLRMQLEVRVPKPVHSDDPAVVIAIELHESGDGGDAREQDHQEHEDRDRDERGAEVIRLRDERQGDHRAGQDREEHAHPGQRLAVGQRTRREQAPMFGGEDLQLGGDPGFTSGRWSIDRHRPSSPLSFSDIESCSYSSCHP
ncbi:MAG: RlpA-like double-psi beta-barrel domain-containing protein [Chloroflexota bacterium]|nr:RlpA-like double-psi beta-barrel domain-containing protein [Chloroflexota bacterium]